MGFSILPSNLSKCKTKINHRKADQILRWYFSANSPLLLSNFCDYHFKDNCSAHAVPSEDRDAALKCRRILLPFMHLLYGWTLCLYVSICPSASCQAQCRAEPVPSVRAHEEDVRQVASVLGVRDSSLSNCSTG